jgi:hypothetical protein
VRITGPGEQAEQDQKMARAGGYIRLPALILASVVEASANNFMAAAATSLYRAGVVMVGAAGQGLGRLAVRLLVRPVRH